MLASMVRSDGCPAAGIVPIVEPDISLTGCHDLETAVWVNVKVQSELYKAMLDHGVYMEGSTLKPNIVNPGRDCAQAYSLEEIAGANLLSGGQSLADAAARLDAMNKAKGDAPWNLSFSWSAALQLPLLELARGGKGLCLEEMSALYLEELQVAGAAARGEHAPKPGEGAHKAKRGGFLG